MILRYSSISWAFIAAGSSAPSTCRRMTISTAPSAPITLISASLRNRMSRAVLRVRDDVIVMQTMMWPDEVRSADFASVDTADAKPAEVKMAKMLVETLAGDFEPDEYEDDYREAVEALVKAKIEGGEVKAAPKERKSGGEVVDLLAALQRSVEAAKTARGESSDDTAADADDEPGEDSGDIGTTRKSAKKAAKKTAKKTAAKTAKKAPAKKAARKAS